MVSQTRENVQRKRKILRRKRRIKFLRVFVSLIVFCTIMAGVGWCSLKLYQWASRTYDTYMEIYDGYKQRRALRAASFDPRFDGYTNILLVGLDPGKEDEGQQADTILLLSFKHDTGAVRFVNIPRYTLSQIPGIAQEERLNHAYTYGGISLLEQTVSGLMDVTLHHYVVMDTSALAEFVDVLGGIDIYVETPMDYDDPEGDLHIHIPKGYQHMNGDTAQLYLRFASDELGAYGRGKRHQFFVKAMYERLLQPDVVADLPRLVDVCNRRVTTSIESFDSAHFANVLSRMSGGRPEMEMLPGGWDSYGSWVCDKEMTAEMMKQLFPVEEAEQKNED